MEDLKNWLGSLKCPDCESGSKIHKSAAAEISCTQCGRVFKRSDGIWDFLPAMISNREGKEKEKTGWQKRSDGDMLSGGGHPPEFYLALPYHEHPYYQAAARYLEIVLEYGKPWVGKKVLDIGAAECWATRRFAEAGSEGVALEYSADPNRMGKAQILLNCLPIHFLRLTGDGEGLPFQDNTFDRIFCCSVLHHFFDFPQAVREIFRTLKPGGVFFGIHEAFHPPYYTEQSVLEMSEDTIPNIQLGINERSYPATYYRRTFGKAGLNFDLVNPRWDTRREGSSLIVKKGTGIYDNPDFVPYSLEKRAVREDLSGLISRFLLRSRLWRIAANPLIFPLIRFQILNWTTKERIIVAKKPA